MYDDHCHNDNEDRKSKGRNCECGEASKKFILHIFADDGV